MSTLHDDRMRTLMARLDDLTPSAPEFEALCRTLTTPTPARRSVWALAAGLVVIVAGLVVIGARRNDTDPSSNRRLTLHSVATRLPNDWEAKGVVAGTPDQNSASIDDLTLFATTAVPTGPILGVLGVYSGSYADPNTETPVTLADGRRATLGTTHLAEARSLDVEITGGRWVELVARDITDDTLLEIGTHVEVDDSGSVVIDGTLPLGLGPVGTSSMFTAMATRGIGVDANELRTGATVTEYGPTGGAADVTITAFTPTGADAAVLGLFGRVAPIASIGIAVSQTYAVDYSPLGGVGVYTVRDGLGFIGHGSSIDTTALLNIMTSLEPVDDQHWNQLLDQRNTTDTSITQVVVTTAVPPPVESPTTGAPTPVDVHYDITSTDNTYTATADMPAGHVSIEMRFVGRSMLIDASLDDQTLATTTASVGANYGGETSTPIDIDGTSFFVWVAPTDDPAAEMRITVDGLVYSTPLVTIDPTYPVKVAVILVPPTSGRSAPPTGYLYDTDGKPLQPV